MSLESTEWENLSLNDFVVLAEISRSSSGAVYKAKRKTTGVIVVRSEFDASSLRIL